MESASTADVDVLLFPPEKRIKSAVWEYFGYQKDDKGCLINTGWPICRTCLVAVSNKAGNTSNMMTHLREYHPALHTEASSSAGVSFVSPSTTLATPRSIRLSFAETIEGTRSKKLNRESKEARALDKAVSYFLAKDMQPFCTVEMPGFKQLVSKLNPKYDMPGRTFFTTKAVPELYNETKAKVQQSLDSACWFSVTTDTWVGCTGKGEPYMSLTVHYIRVTADGEWKLESHCLDTCYIPEDYSGMQIAEAFQEMLQEWSLNVLKLSSVITESATSMKKAFSERMKLQWLGCFGQNLNLAVHKSLKIEIVESAVNLCRNVVSAFNKSWKKKRELTTKQAELGMEQQTLIQDTTTKWGGIYEMVARLLEQRQPVRAVLAADQGNLHLNPMDTDIAILEDLAAVLGPLHEFTDSLASEKYVTVSALRPVLHHILNDILGEKYGDTSLARDLKTCIAGELKSCYASDNVKILDVCSFLDPRFKSDFVTDLPSVTVDLMECISAVEENIFTTQSVATSTKLESGASSAGASANVTTSPVKEEVPGAIGAKTNKLGAILKKITAANQLHKEGTDADDGASLASRVRKEIHHYISEPLYNAESDPLRWWSVRCIDFPLLSKAAEKYLCIPATSVPSERAFGTPGQIVTPFKSQLSHEHLNMLIFLHHNLK
ncbi:E3 SUMO-protein ligase ZBED1-like [Lampetra planeri]